jgi:tetratricopeptide (TPR) repeat protein
MRLTRTHLTICTAAIAATICATPTLRAQNPEAAKVARGAAEAAKAKDWNKAVDGFRHAAEMDRKFADNYFAALVQRGAAFREQQKFAEAVGDFSEALKIKPGDADTHERRAYVELQMKDYDKALADYTASLKADPKEARVYMLRSYVYELKGDAKNGIADCDTVLKITPGNPEATARKGRLLARLNAPPPAPTMPPGPIKNPNLKPPQSGPAAQSNVPPTSPAASTPAKP